MAFIPAQRTVGFDNRLGWNDAISHYLEDIRLNRVAGNNQGWLNALWGIWDMGKTFLFSNNDTVIEVDRLLNETQKLVWNLDGLTNLNDKNVRHSQRIILYKVTCNLSKAQVLAFKLMGDKGMFLPLKVPVEEYSEKDAIEGSGMGYVKYDEDEENAETILQGIGI
jgi:hypothetical protein